MEEIDRCINSNGIVFLIAYAAYRVEEKADGRFSLTLINHGRIPQHSLDNVFDCMAEKELTEIGIDMEQLLPKPLPFKQQLHKSTIERKAKIDISEVKNLQAEMIGFHGYFKNKGRIRNVSTNICNL